MDIQDKGTLYTITFSRMYILEIWHTCDGSETERARHVLQKVMHMVPDSENCDIEVFRQCVQKLSKRLMDYWKKANRCLDRLKKNHSEWLMQQEVVDLIKSSATGGTSLASESVDVQRSFGGGRPKKDFSDCSRRSQRRRLADLSKVDKTAVNTLMDTSSHSDTKSNEVSADEVLSLFTEAKLTKHQYMLIKEFINSKTSPILPSYQKLLDAKKRCYPENLIVSETGAEVELQSLLDHTAKRIVDLQEEVLSSIPFETLGELHLFGKWGFDGSTGHGEYKQSFSENPELDDGSMLVTSYVPLRLVSIVQTTEEVTVIWKNPRPSSTRYCRPIRFKFAKETKELSIQEEQYFKEKISNLLPTAYKDYEINHELQLTMVDGKVCSALSDTSTATCFLCGASPKEMNKIDESLEKEIDTANLEFGLSPLHSWIRFFEYLIHVSYRLDFKTWQARSTEAKQLLATRKTRIQKEFKQKLGLIVDKPRSGGSGTSNDGNTARRFFANSAVSSEITGLKKDLIDRCGTILSSLSSGYKINPTKFKTFATDTARLLVQEYPWYNLPPSVHKVLIHGSEVIDSMMLSIVELSEEAAESTNKNIKLFRLNNTRKFSRETTNSDLLNRLLLNSDPFITSLRKLPRKKKTTLSKSVLSLLDL